MKQIIDKLVLILDSIPEVLLYIKNDAAEEKTFGIKSWSKKEMIGHLIDSSMVNLQRILRLACEGQDKFDKIIQDEWVKYQNYNKVNWRRLVDLFVGLNQQTLHLMQMFTDSFKERQVTIGGKKITVTLMVQEYLDHLEHHLRKIIAGTE